MFTYNYLSNKSIRSIFRYPKKKGKKSKTGPSCITIMYQNLSIQYKLKYIPYKSVPKVQLYAMCNELLHLPMLENLTMWSKSGKGYIVFQGWVVIRSWRIESFLVWGRVSVNELLSNKGVQQTRAKPGAALQTPL